MILVMHNQPYHQFYSIDGILSVMSPTHSQHQNHSENERVTGASYWHTADGGAEFCGKIYLFIILLYSGLCLS